MRTPALRLNDHDPALLKKLAFIERGYLAVVAVIAIGALAAHAVPGLERALPGDWIPVAPPIAIAALLSAVGLEFSRSSQPGVLRRFGLMFTLLLAMVSGAALVEELLHIPIGIEHFVRAAGGVPGTEHMPALTAATFAALALVILLTPAQKGLASHAADLSLAFFCLLVLVMIRSYLFQGLWRQALVERTSLFTLLALALLAFVAFMHRAENGIFATLLGEGSGSKIARIAAPLVLLVPFLPQAAIADLVKSGLIHAEYLNAMMAFAVAGLSLVVMLYMALKINRLEAKVRDLATRDEDTGLNNRRGFILVAWQALRQARRDGLPFSILFVELDNLAEVRETLGPNACAEMLAEIAEIVRAAFRATDVLGRTDPAQFAVAGHFDEKAAKIMRLRVQEAVNYRNANPGRTYSFAISARSVHARDPRTDSIEDLMMEADDQRDPEPAPPAAETRAIPTDAR